MKRYIGIILTLVLVLLTTVGCGTKKDTRDTSVKIDNKKLSEITANLDKVFTDSFGSDKFSGYVYISKNGTTLLDKAYGKADFEKGIDNTKQTKFDVASLTKQFTAFAIMQLEEKKLLNVNDTVNKYLPALPHGSEITIHQLLTHTSGLPEHSLEFDIKKFRPSNKGFGTEGKDEKVTLSFAPGTNFTYSNTGYLLLGYIIEKVSGETLDVYLSKNIFKPLNMINTGFKDANGQFDGLAQGYQTEKKEKSEKPWYLINVGSVLGSSALCTTVEDLIAWEKALTEQKLLSKESYERIYTPDKQFYGYGWYIYKDLKENKSYEHYGNAGGYRSFIMRAVDEDIQVIILSNYANTPMGDMVGLVKLCLR